MAYVKPVSVCAPKVSVRSVEVLYDTGSGGWSAARIDWEGRERIGIRWNGAEGSPGIGNPQSRGNATWFIIPEDLEAAVRGRLEDLTYNGPGGLIERYSEMANDDAREREADEWSEGLIGDAPTQR